MKIMSTAIRALPLQLREEWLDFLPTWSLPSTTPPTGAPVDRLNPFMATLGFNPRLPVDLLTQPPTQPMPATNMIQRLHYLRKEAHAAVLLAQA